MGCVRSVPLDGPRGPSARREGFAKIDVNDGSRGVSQLKESLWPMPTAARLKLGRIGLGSSTPKAVPARAKGRCEMMPDPTPPYRAPDFCPDCREKFLAVVGWIAPALESTLSPAPPEPITTPEDTLRRAGISSERQAVYQRRMSSLLAGRG